MSAADTSESRGRGDLGVQREHSPCQCAPHIFDAHVHSETDTGGKNVAEHYASLEDHTCRSQTCSTVGSQPPMRAGNGYPTPKMPKFAPGDEIGISGRVIEVVWGSKNNRYLVGLWSRRTKRGYHVLCPAPAHDSTLVDLAWGEYFVEEAALSLLSEPRKAQRCSSEEGESTKRPRIEMQEGSDCAT